RRRTSTFGQFDLFHLPHRRQRRSKRLRKAQQNMKHVKIEREIGGRTLTLETGKIAKLANSAVVATYGGTTVLATVVRADPRPGLDFFPMQVDYREKLTAAGKFPGG